MKTLPNNLHGLLKVALSDLKKCAKDNKYEFSMADKWHSPTENGKCAVCMAGSVMAKSFKLPVDLNAEPDNFLYSNQVKLIAINDMRRGAFFRAFTVLNNEFFSDDEDALNDKITESHGVDTLDALKKVCHYWKLLDKPRNALSHNPHLHFSKWWRIQRILKKKGL